MAPRLRSPRPLPVPLTGGHNSVRDPSFMEGQLVRSQGAEYRVGDPTLIHKIPGRTLVGTLDSGTQVAGGLLATYDDGTAFILAVGGTGLYHGDATTVTATFTNLTLPVARSSDTTKITGAHTDNRWYVVTGENTNLVVEADATVVTHGMTPPGNGRLTATTSQLGDQFELPTGNGGGLVTATVSGSDIAWVDTGEVGLALFDEESPYAALNLNTPDTEGTIEYEFTATASFTNKAMEIYYRVSNVQYGLDTDTEGDGLNDEKPGWEAELRIEVSTNNGSSFTEFHLSRHEAAQKQIHSAYIPIDDSIAIDQIHFRLKFKLLRDFGRVGIFLYNAELHNNAGRTTHTNTTGALYYAITEYDALRGWESNISDFMTIPVGESYRSVHVRLPSAQNTPNATHYRVYRTSNVSAVWTPANLGLINQISITTGISTYTDMFQHFGPEDRPFPGYEMLIQNEFGTNIFFEINSPPPAMSFIGNFGGALFGLNNRSYHQAIPGRPWQWPGIFVIDRMPFKEHSPLQAAYQVGERLWIGTEAGIILLESPIEMKQRQLILPTPVRLEGAPGCVGEYAATPMTFNGEGLIAWVANHGIYVSNLATYERITDDIAWETELTEASLSSSVLFWREKKEQLVLLYDKSGNGTNDSFALIHLGKDLRTANGQPLITWDHPGDFSHWWGGRVNGAWKEWTGQSNSTRGIYLEGGSATADASQSHDGSTDDIPFDVETGKTYFDRNIDVGRARLFHTSPSSTFTLTVGFTTGRDSDVDRTKELLLSISGSRGHQLDFNVHDAGEFMQWRFQRTGQESFALGPVTPFIEGGDKPGDFE